MAIVTTIKCDTCEEEKQVMHDIGLGLTTCSDCLQAKALQAQADWVQQKRSQPRSLRLEWIEACLYAQGFR